MPRYLPVEDETGAVRMVKHPGRIPLDGSPPEMSFHQTVLNAYRQVESDGKFQGPYPKGMAKRVHETAAMEKRA